MTFYYTVLRKRFCSAALAGAWLLFASSCSKDQGELPSAGCGNVTYSYNGDIKAIIDTKCAISGCHDSQSAKGGVTLTDYAQVKARVGRIQARAIDGQPSFMPPTGKLPDSTLAKIKQWIEEGACESGGTPAPPPCPSVAAFAFLTDSTLTAAFTDSSSAVNSLIGEWQWDFGDSSQSMQKNPKHAYVSAGAYQVCLTVTDTSGCTGKTCKTVTVPFPKCDTVTYTYTNGIGAIFTAKCAKSPCHDNITQAGGVMLQTYLQVKEKVDKGRIQVRALDLPWGGMPQDGQLAADTIAMIRLWINCGAGQ